MHLHLLENDGHFSVTTLRQIDYYCASFSRKEMCVFTKQTHQGGVAVHMYLGEDGTNMEEDVLTEVAFCFKVYREYSEPMKTRCKQSTDLQELQERL